MGAAVVEGMTGNFGQPRERRGHGRTTRLMHERETVVRGFVKCHGGTVHPGIDLLVNKFLV